MLVRIWDRDKDYDTLVKWWTQWEFGVVPKDILPPDGIMVEDDGVPICAGGLYFETKKTKLGKGSKANHFAYLGDADVGSDSNIGAGTITCNYDGKDKHKTIVGNNTFVGTNSSLVAPVTVGSNSYVAAGSVITKDVPDNALGVGRSKQENKENWSKKKD